jgi:hypothetical protein
MLNVDKKLKKHFTMKNNSAIVKAHQSGKGENND